MDPITGIGLAASLATLGEIAAKSSKALYHLSKRVRDAPAALKELCEEVESLQQLLEDVSVLVRHELGDHDIGLDLRRLAQAKQEAMTKNLEDFEKWVSGLKKQLDLLSSSGRHVRTRVVKALSEREIGRFRNAFAANREVLNTLQSQIASRQIFKLTKMSESSFGAVYAHFGDLQQRIDGVATAIHEDNSALTRIEERLLKIDSHLRLQPLRLASSIRRRNPAIDEDDAVESRKQTTVWWKASEFRLPTGTLLVQNPASLDESSNQNAQYTYRCSVRFMPATWFPDLAILASGEV